MWNEFGDQKYLTRIPYTRSLRHRHTFCIKPDSGEIDFFTSSGREVYLMLQGCESKGANET
jgi:hypothetical protein